MAEYNHFDVSRAFAARDWMGFKISGKFRG